MTLLFHDSIHMAAQGTATKIIPFDPQLRVEEVVDHANAKVLACKPCANVRCGSEADLDKRVAMAGMNKFMLPRQRTMRAWSASSLQSGLMHTLRADAIGAVQMFAR